MQLLTSTVISVQLRGYLKQLRLPANSEVPFSITTVTPAKFPSLDVYLSHLVKHGYLDKIKSSAPLPGSTQPLSSNKRSRPNKGDEGEGDVSFLWKWGARAHAEISEKVVTEFIVEFMMEAILLTHKSVLVQQSGIYNRNIY